MTNPGPVRFFLTLRVQPAYTFVALAGVLAIAIFTIALDPTQLDAGLAMILLVQMFLASTGVTTRAHRGHFDPILVDRANRLPVFSAHFLVSVLPGLTAWVVFAATAALLGNPTARDALAGARVVSLLIVSAGAWSLGFVLPRGAAGVLWAAVMFAFGIRGIGFRLLAVGAHGWFAAALSTLACPFMLLGLPVAGSVVFVDAIIAAGVVVAVCRVADRLDCSLVDYSS